MSDAARYYDESYPPTLWAPPSTVTNLNPNTKAVGAAGFILTITGTGFRANSVASFEGDPRPTTVVSPTQLTVSIAGITGVARTATVSVSSGGSAPFTITATELNEETAEAPQGAAEEPGAATVPDAPEPSPEGPTGAAGGQPEATPVTDES